MKTNEVNKEISYETLLVTFGEGIGRLDTMFDDPQVWGVATLKQWIDGMKLRASPKSTTERRLSHPNTTWTA